MMSPRSYILIILVLVLFMTYVINNYLSLAKSNTIHQLLLGAYTQGSSHNINTLLDVETRSMCPLEYFKSHRNSLHKNRQLEISGLKNYQTHLGSDILNTNSTLAPFVNHNITTEFNSSYLNPCWFEHTEKKPRRLKCLPYFFLAGFPKCGTTDLYLNMALHPQIDLNHRKEPHWWAITRLPRPNRIDFTTGDVNNAKVHDLRTYLSYFDTAAQCMEQISQLHLEDQVQLVTGDGSASTAWDNRYWHLMPGNAGLSEPRVLIADHIRHFLPDSKFIFILREPSARLWSDYLYFWTGPAGSSPSAEDFHNKASASIKTFTACLESKPPRACAYGRNMTLQVRIRIGLYSIFLKDWYSVFPRQQFHVLRTEDYAKSRTMELQKIFAFLGLDGVSNLDRSLDDLPKQNSQTSNGSLSTMWPETKQMIHEFYAPYNADLSKLLNNNNYLWKDVS